MAGCGFLWLAGSSLQWARPCSLGTWSSLPKDHVCTHAFATKPLSQVGLGNSGISMKVESQQCGSSHFWPWSPLLSHSLISVPWDTVGSLGYTCCYQLSLAIEATSSSFLHTQAGLSQDLPLWPRACLPAGASSTSPGMPAVSV